MMKLIRSLSVTLGIIGFCLVSVPTTNAAAVSVFGGACTSTTESSVCGTSNPSTSSAIKTVVNTLLFVLGALSVVVIIIAGILYTTSAGDSGKVTTAKNTLTYAIIGLVVAVLAFAIVNFVVSIFNKK